MAEQQKRQIAFKIRIKDLQSGQYVKQEGWQPNYVITSDGKQISRVNIIGIVVSTPMPDSFPSVILDDGTGRINVRVFDEKSNILDKAMVGDVTLLIGRPREYGGEKYIVPEIIKKIEDKRWIEVRKLELNEPSGAETTTAKRQEEPVQEAEEIETEAEDIEEVPKTDLTQSVYDTIKELDKGDGADYEDILKRCGSDKEKTIKMLLEQGEVFEIKPGKLKILE